MANTRKLISGEFSVTNGAGMEILRGTSISGMPSVSAEINLQSPLAKRAIHLASDLLKGTVNLPGKSIELIFHPEIQARLNEGTLTLMKTKTGDVLADAIDKTGKIAGKGRVVEPGSLRQLASGAFQLTSIVVAQSHLADIERSLKALKSGLDAILANLESTDKSNIKGSIAYLLKLGEAILTLQPAEELSIQMKQVVENLVLSSFVWREKLFEDMRSLITQAQNQGDADSWGGTENTHKVLKAYCEAAAPLLLRHELLMHFHSLLHFVVTYIDPNKNQHARPEAESSIWFAQAGALATTLEQKSEKLLRSSVFNSEEILRYRRQEIKTMAVKFRFDAVSQQTRHDRQVESLAANIDKYFRKNEGIRIAVKFDDTGKAIAAAIH